MLAALAVPILAAKCLTCHGPETKTNGLDLSTRAGLLAGGKSGPALVTGDPAGSRLYQYVASRKMPPGQPLTAEETEAIRKWIEEGAIYGAARIEARSSRRAGLDWWSLQSPRKPAVPVVPGFGNPVDAFLLAKLQEKKLTFAPRADSRTLIRRLFFDLTGLPPAPEDLSLTYEQAVEKLLASPRYGERWGRHWLDTVRFGESDGGEHNNERLTAWKYRDYVIDAFNSGKPYNQFLREQIAGDVIDPSNPGMVAATGFLVAGPWDSVTKKINRDEMMRKTLRQDELDDFVSTAFATFQGLTVNCARCHDHKFDPIPTRDYYRLTAVFRGVTYGERDVYSEAQKKERDAAIAPLRRRLSEVNEKLSGLEAAVRTRLLAEKYRAANDARPAGARRIAVNPVLNHNTFPPAAARHFRFIVTAQYGAAAMRLDRFELLPAVRTIENWKAAAAASDDKPVAVEFHFDAPVTVGGIRWTADARTGAREGAPRVYRFEVSEDGAAWRTVASSLDHDVPAEFELPEVSEDELLHSLPQASIEPRRLLLAERKRIQDQIDGIAPLATVHAALLEPKMTPAFVLERGSVARPLEEVTPGALSAVRQVPSDLDAASDGSRRLALANWLADAGNPLTARVIVNRIWYHHFGNGIVNTPSDFGFNGDRPSHPELLDWLATEFVGQGWSMRWLHRLILASRAYQQSSRLEPRAMAADASNRLLWRMAPRRMDAETLRDSILFVAGSLNPERGGPGFLLQKKGSRGSYLYLALPGDGPAVWRRAIYRFVPRGGERVFLDSFDCPDPAVATPQRAVSNTPVQALTLLNNDFVLRQAVILAERLRREAGADAAAQTRRAYQLLFLRDPTAHESALARKYLASHGLANYCRVLLNTNEFVYAP